MPAKPQPLSPRSLRRFLVVCAALMFAGGSFLYRDELGTPADYGLLAVTCALFVTWAAFVVKLNKAISRLPLIIRVLGFAGTMLFVFTINLLIRRSVLAEFPRALFSMPFPLIVMMPLFNGFFGHFPSAGKESCSAAKSS